MRCLPDLPVESLIEILRHLDLRDVLRCTAVCTKLHDVVKNSLELQYNIELAADGLVDDAPSPLPVSERLARLLELRARWRSLDWKEVTPVSIPGDCQAYDLVGGVFVSSKKETFESSEHVMLSWLPTHTSPGSTIERHGTGIRTDDVVLDPSQDLLIIKNVETSAVEARTLNLHIRTMSSNEPHPQATHPLLQAPYPDLVFPAVQVQVAEDVLGVFILWDNSINVFIWNWRLGALVVNCSQKDLHTGIDDFCLLSSRAFMVTWTTGSGAIALYTFDGEPPARLPTLVAELRLPSLEPGGRLHGTHIISEPHLSQTAKPQFDTDEDSRIYSLSLNYAAWSGCTLFLPHRFLRSLLRHSESAPSAPEHTSVVMEWHTWGPNNTRMIPIRMNLEWLRFVHGSRVVLPRVNAGWDNIRVWDFNVHPKRTNDPVGSGLSRIVQEATVISRGFEFEHWVVTRLPYAEVSKPAPPARAEYSGVMIDHSRLIGMRSGDAGSYVNMDVYVF